MKDAFFQALKNIYLRVYSIVLKITYLYKSHSQAGGRETLDHEYKYNIKQYWAKFGLNAYYRDYKFYKHIGQQDNPKLIPSVIWHGIIEPRCCRIDMVTAFEDKNYMDVFLGQDYAPNALVRCIDGMMLDIDFRKIDIQQVLALCQNESSVVVKPTIGTGGGRGVTFLNGSEVKEKLLEDWRSEYGENFCIQSLIEQHPWFSQFNPSSTNSIRLVTYLGDTCFYPLSAFLRIGAPGAKVDNICAGGRLIQIDIKSGHLLRLSLDKDVKRIPIEDGLIESFGSIVPFWERMIHEISLLHRRLSHFKIINWDIVIDSDNKTRILEYNLIDSSIDWHQANIGPIFGESSDIILEEIFKCQKL